MHVHGVFYPMHCVLLRVSAVNDSQLLPKQMLAYWRAAPSAPWGPAGRTEPAAPSARLSGISAAAWLSAWSALRPPCTGSHLEKKNKNTQVLALLSSNWSMRTRFFYFLQHGSKKVVICSQMIADWQMQVISTLTNMLEEVCCSSRLPCTQ